MILSNWGTPIWPGSPGIALHVRRCFGLSKYEAVRRILDNTRDWALNVYNLLFDERKYPDCDLRT